MSKPKKAYVEITNRCNLSCPFCPPAARPARSMTEGEFATVARGLRGVADAVYFHVKGEPLIHPRLGDFIDIAGREGLEVRITTNGTLLARRIADLSPKRPLGRLNVSLHGVVTLPPSEASAALDAIFDAAEEIIARNREITPGFLVSYRLWTADDDAGTGFALARLAARYGIDPAETLATLAKKGGARIHANAAIHAADTFEWPSLGGPDRGERGFCRGLRDQIGVLADGTVVPCCLDADGIVDLGNAFDVDLRKILAGPRAVALYRSFTERRIAEPLCRHCGYRSRFDAP